MHFDVFNGDADGICSLLQLRLQQPADSQRVTESSGISRSSTASAPAKEIT